MTRIMELFVVVNAACGIAAFLIARGLINKARQKTRDILRDDEEEIRSRSQKEILP